MDWNKLFNYKAVKNALGESLLYTKLSLHD